MDANGRAGRSAREHLRQWTSRHPGLQALAVALVLGCVVMASAQALQYTATDPGERASVGTQSIGCSPPANSPSFTVLAGGRSASLEDGDEASAYFASPNGIAAGPLGTFFVADSQNHTIRRVDPNGTVTTLAGLAGQSGWDDGVGAAARFGYPRGLAIDSHGDLVVAEYWNNIIRRVTPGGVVQTVAGSAPSTGYNDGIGDQARFNMPRGVAVGPDDTIYVADTMNNTIRRIAPDGTVTTLAGLHGAHGSLDGVGSLARFYQPSGVAVDGDGNVFVTDQMNSTIRKITPDGTVTTLAGLAGATGALDGTAAEARFDHPSGIALDASGDLIVADLFASTIRRVTQAGVVTTIAGSAYHTGGVDGLAGDARFIAPAGVAVGADGQIAIVDVSDDTVRLLDASGNVTTLTGHHRRSGADDGPGATATFRVPAAASVGPGGNVFIADSGANTIRVITPAGDVSTLAGLAGWPGAADGNGPDARFSQPGGVAVAADGVVYVADTSNHTIRKVLPDGTASTLAGSPGVPGHDDGTGADARFKFPVGIVVGYDGNLYVADRFNDTIRRVTPSGEVTTVAGLALQSGSADGIGSAARFSSPAGIALDRDGNLIVADAGNHTLRLVAPDGEVTTLAGTAGAVGTDDGTGTAARFFSPWGVAVDCQGDIFVADTGNFNIRRVTPAGVVSTVAGAPESFVDTPGSGTEARLGQPEGIAVDENGRIIVADATGPVVWVAPQSIDDVATIDTANGTVGFTQQLGTSPQTATSWKWEVIRRPAGSIAELSSTTIPNPTFVGDVADLFVFRLTAENADGMRISTIELNARPAAQLSVSLAGTGAGSVTADPGGISCGSVCLAIYESGTVVTLTATTAAGSTFTGWSGACSGTGACTLTLDVDAAVTATFALDPPAAPSNLVALLQRGSNQLYWVDHAANETGFAIERRTPRSSIWGEIARVGADVTRYIDSTWVTNCTYRVRAFNAAGMSGYTNEATPTNGLPVLPAAPTALNAVAVSSGRIDLAWTNTASNELGVRIERRTGGGAYALIAELGANATGYGDTGVSPATTYTYRASAFNSFGASAYSNDAIATTPSDVPTAPAAPSGLTATPVSPTEIDLTWTDASNNEAGFTLEVKGPSGFWEPLADTGANVHSFPVTGLLPEHPYVFRVGAFNDVGASSWSNEASATTPAVGPSPPSAPTFLTATAVSTVAIDLGWTDTADNETGFNVQIRQAPSGDWSDLVTLGPDVTAYAVTALTPGTTYTFRVRSTNAGGPSSWSNEATATTTASGPTIPPAPSALVASVSGAGVSFGWVDNSGNEDGFMLERRAAYTATWVTVGQTDTDVTQFTDAQVVNGASYTYRVIAFNEAGNSAPSPSVTIKVPLRR